MNIVNVGYHSTNYYSLDIMGGKLLVDCGWPGSLREFIAQLRRKSIDPSEIKYLLVTHFHPDHAGLVQELKDIGAQLILLESQSSALRPEQSRSAPTSSSSVTVSPEDNLRLSFAESRQFLSSIGLSGEIIATRGHSEDSISLILDDGSVFTGDLPPRDLVTDQDQITKQSWDRIYQHNVTRIFPAHGS